MAPHKVIHLPAPSLSTCPLDFPLSLNQSHAVDLDQFGSVQSTSFTTRTCHSQQRQPAHHVGEIFGDGDGASFLRVHDTKLCAQPQHRCHRTPLNNRNNTSRRNDQSRPQKLPAQPVSREVRAGQLERARALARAPARARKELGVRLEGGHADRAASARTNDPHSRRD